MNPTIEAARQQMIFQQVRAWAVLNPAVLKAMSEVPRERFVPEGYRDLAFADTAIPLADGQHMLTPQIEGRILQALDVAPGNRVLEVGTGTGYLTACLAALGGSVLSLDIRPAFTDGAKRAVHAAGARNAEVITADVFAYQPDGQFDCIAVGGSLPVPDTRFEQWLKPGGRLFMVTGEGPAMTAWLLHKDESGGLAQQSLFETVVQPLDNAARPDRFVF